MTRLARGRGHTYKLDGAKVPGVTSIIGVLDKPALVGWAANVTAEAAVERWDELATFPPLQRYDELKGARFNVNRKATTDGKRIHYLGEQLAHGGEVEVPEHIRGQVQAYARFLDDWQLEPLFTEAAVGSSENLYAGTLDAVMTSPRIGTCLFDLKSGKGVYGEVAMQLAAYANADLRLERTVETGPRGGKKNVDVEHTPAMPALDGFMVAHILSDAVSMLPITVTERTFEFFLYCRELWEWKQAQNRDNPDAYDPPVGEAIFPEQYPADGSRIGVDDGD